MRPRSKPEFLGSLLVVLATAITIALLIVVGSLKTASADLSAQVAVLQDSSKAAPRGFVDRQLSAALSPDLAPDDIQGLANRSQLLDHRSDRLLEVTAVVALLGMLLGLVASRPANQANRPRDATTPQSTTNGTL